MKIEHIAMYVNDLESVRDFFVKYFGAVCNDGYYNSKTGFRSYFLLFDDGARLEIMNKPQMEDEVKSPVRSNRCPLLYRNEFPTKLLGSRLHGHGHWSARV